MHYDCRLVEAVRQKCGGVQLQNEDVYMATTFGDFVKQAVLVSRGVTTTKELVYDAVSMSTTSLECAV